MSFAGIFGASGTYCVRETRIQIGKNWEATITSRIGRESFGSFLLERRKRTRQSKKNANIGDWNSLLHGLSAWFAAPVCRILPFSI